MAYKPYWVWDPKASSGSGARGMSYRRGDSHLGYHGHYDDIDHMPDDNYGYGIHGMEDDYDDDEVLEDWPPW